MEPRLLRYFVAVAEELHLARAAERLGIEQSPVSRAIRDLERLLGISLFDRSARQTRLTWASQVLLGEARRVLATVDQAVQATKAAAQGYQSYLRIAICDSLASRASPRYWRAVARKSPNWGFGSSSCRFRGSSRACTMTCWMSASRCRMRSTEG